MVNSLKEKLLQNIKNIYGWKTNRKIVVFSVDDYGNVRLDSKKARENMDHAGLKVKSRFDAHDTLESREDLEMLFEALASVKDKNGRNAVFTPYALPCNINFEAMAENGYQEYVYEILPQTYKKLEAIDAAAYRGAWDMWKEGIAKGLMVPQFHGREHLNLKVFKEKLKNKDAEVLTALKNRSYTSISDSGYATIKVSAAFDFWEFEENKSFAQVITEGLSAFEDVFGYKAVHFTPPAYNIHPVNHQTLAEGGIKYIDTGLIQKEHQGSGKYKIRFNYTGKRNNHMQYTMVRNVVFEPTNDAKIDSVALAMKQIETAFKWNKPAIISSHRVNFCGYVNPANRRKGMDELRLLLKKIVDKWPDTEFMAANELGDLISEGKK